jgi:iron complex outermembrane receptor protein
MGAGIMSHRREKRARRITRFAIMTAVSLETSFLGQAALAADPAQTTQAAEKPDELQEIVVTGFRASLQTALDTKRDSNLPIESVAPEDIGKMPDQNVAESLQRLPGIQIDRGPAGQGTSVLIDGLRQNLTTLNGDLLLTGREFYVSGEASGGGSGANSQYASLEGIPSELITGIDVYKNPKASMTEGGLGGTIDLKTRDALAQPQGLSLAGNFRESQGQDVNNSLTPDGTLVASYKVNDRLAFTGSFTFDDEKTHTKEFQDQNRAAWIITNSATGPYSGPLTAAGLSTLPNNQYYIDPQLGYFSDIFDYRDDKGASIGAQWRVTDSITTSVNWFYSHEDDTSYTYTNKSWFNGNNTPAGTLFPGIDPTQPYSIDGNGVVQNGTFNANGAENATLFQQNISEANNYQWATKFNNGGPLRGAFDASYAKATSNLQAAQADVEQGLYLTGAGVPTAPTAPGCNNGGATCPPPGPGNQGYTFAYSNGGTSGLPSVNYLAPYANVLNDAAYTTFKSNWAWANYTDNKQFGIKGDLQWDTNVFNVPTTLESGARYAGRNLDQVFGRYLINGTLADGQVAGGNTGCNTPAAPNTCGPWLYYQDPGYGTPGIPYSTGASNPGLVMTVPNFGVGNIIVKNPTTGGLSNPSTYLNRVWSGAGVPNNTEQFFEDPLSSFDVKERTIAPYLMADLGNSASRYHLNVGVRFVHTDLTINNGQTAASPTYYGTAVWNGVDSNVVPVRTDRNYNDVLPSINLVYDLSESQKLRFGAAKVMSPQDLYQLGVGNSYNFSRNATRINPTTDPTTGQPGGFSFINGNSGNPNLDPYRASQFYLSYENYFTPGGLISIAGFYKKVENFIEIKTIPTLVNDDFGGDVGPITEPVNAGQGKIYGAELGAQYAFGSNLARWLNGFGFAANYTYSQSTTDSQTTSFSYDSAIPGVAKNSATGTLYYERFGFSARASYSWRDKAVNDSLVGSVFTFPDQNNVQKTYQVFSAPYGQLDAQIGYDFNAHVGVFFSGQNLTDQAQHTYLQWPDLPFTYDNSGRRFFVGIKGKL